MTGRPRLARGKPELPLPDSRIERADLSEDDVRLLVEIWLQIGREERAAAAR